MFYIVDIWTDFIPLHWIAVGFSCYLDISKCLQMAFRLYPKSKRYETESIYQTKLLPNRIDTLWANYKYLLPFPGLQTSDEIDTQIMTYYTNKI